MPELAVITGAARGIGAAVALELARGGAALLLVDACSPQPATRYPMPSPAELDAVAERCLAAGAAAADVLRADVAEHDFARVLDEALGDRPVVAAVAAAGLIADGDAWATDEEAWDVLLGVNLHGTRRLAESVVPRMIAARHGRFVAVASAAALRAMPRLAAYSAAKAAVAAYVRALAADLAGTGVTANAVCPGSTRGAMLEASAEVYGLPGQESFAAQQLVRRLLEPEEVAAAIAWLCGPQASALTGAVLPVDGGLTS
jgi:SDR family mycofactocin-dependent oxidoreductase